MHSFVTVYMYKYLNLTLFCISQLAFVQKDAEYQTMAALDKLPKSEMSLYNVLCQAY